MVTAAAVAHVNRLPVLLLPGDVFANRKPDPVLQQIESFSDDSVGILVAGKYLAADWGGTAANDREWCRDWERFRLVRADTVAALTLQRRLVVKQFPKRYQSY